MPASAPPTKPCPHCGQPMGVNRGVCPNLDCDYQSTWFRIRLYFGCAGAIIAFLCTLLMGWMAIRGGQ